MKPTVWIQPGIVAIYGRNMEVELHHHNSIEVIWGEAEYKLNGCNVVGASIIDSMHEHQLEMSDGWILLIEPKSKLGEQLFAKLAGDPVKSFNIAAYSSAQTPTTNEALIPYLTPLFDALNICKDLLRANQSCVEDHRIHTLLSELNNALDGDYMEPTSWKAADVAQMLALSESRFLHLFAEEMGIAWRPYLLWRRLICAVKELTENRTATDAAYLSGFSDSSHLSRTFRNNFGLSIRQAAHLFKH